MLVEVVTHPLQSKYVIGSSGAPNSIITAYASAAAAPAIAELLKQIETPCLKLCAFLATHCQVICIPKRTQDAYDARPKPNPMRSARRPFAERGTGGGAWSDVRGGSLSSRSVQAVGSVARGCEHDDAGVGGGGQQLLQHIALSHTLL